MVPQIVSDSFETDVIQRRIVHNLYENPVVVCDVSGLNPNVMFELGMRLTFMKPVVIVTDDLKRIPFDTGVIEHLAYPRDLHIHKTQEFIEQLTEKVKLLHAQVAAGKFKPFLETFGKFEVFQPSTESVPADRFIAERLEDLTRTVRRLERGQNSSDPANLRRRFIHEKSPISRAAYLLPNQDNARTVARNVENLPGVESINLRDSSLTVDINVTQGPATETYIDDIVKSYWSAQHED